MLTYQEGISIEWQLSTLATVWSTYWTSLNTLVWGGWTNSNISRGSFTVSSYLNNFGHVGGGGGLPNIHGIKTAFKCTYCTCSLSRLHSCHYKIEFQCLCSVEGMVPAHDVWLRYLLTIWKTRYYFSKSDNETDMLNLSKRAQGRASM